MNSKKFKTLILAMAAVLVQSTSVYATSNKSDYTREDLENIQPGFGWEDIYKSQYKVSTSVNNYSSTQTPKEIAEKLGDESDSTTSSSTTSTDSADTQNSIVKTMPSTGRQGDWWGKTSSGKWMLFEQGVPVIGWKQVSGKWYYMDLEGIMQTGWLNDGVNWYYLGPSGDMAYNTYVDGYYVDWNGVMQ